jgi:RNA polymerase sigma-70 factor (ECF subfamily)
VPAAADQSAPEREALALLGRGDARGAVAVLVRAHGADVFRFCREQLGDAHAAEDMLQTVFIQAFQSIGAYEPRSTLRAWLFGIARHRCMDAARSRRRWLRVVEPQDELPERADPGPSAEHGVAAAGFARALDECLEALPPKSRETLALRFRAGLSYEEAAEASGEQVGTLRVRVARALPALRQCLEAKEVLP